MRSPFAAPESLPTTVAIGGREHPIRHDFRAGIEFETLVFDASVPEHTKIALALGIYFPEGNPEGDLRKTLDAMLTFYRCGLPPEDGPGVDEPLYSYRYDHKLIFAGFLSSYGIDLYAIDYLHWWRFRAMLEALPDDSQFKTAVGYRAAKVTSEMSKEQRKHLRKMKRLYALPQEAVARPVRLRSQDEVLAAVDAILAAKREGPS